MKKLKPRCLKAKTKSQKTTNKINSLYIHIPFCEHLCHYCDFAKLFYDENLANKYLDVLFSEIDSYQIKKVKTIYIGGGTPSSLNISQLEKLLKKVTPFLSAGGEFSFELNVENITLEKLKLLKFYGVNRLSIGVQSTNLEILKSLNRQHSFVEVEKNYYLARELGFNNISLDLIYGTPKQNIEILEKDLENLLKLNPEHLSIYELSIHPNTVFYLNNIKPLDEDESRKQYNLILKILRNRGYKRYEIANFAKPNYQSKHNLTYWQNKNYYGVGLGAHGYIKNLRYQNTKSLTKYLKGEIIYEKEILSLEDEEKYFWITNLRLEEGFKIDEYISRYGKKRFQRRIDQLKQTGLFKYMIKSNNQVRLNDDGLMLLDYLLIEII
ncbi:MAG: radical SAM family heme chaperone HemW [Bacilli bacterium]|jgi:oxygen-independent coproporphyrinogen-3 oxidase|nr:radical SAM family heme chaperone HemW [Bacilli bacterium]NLN80223.1 radical SAM family heme chaperone HemW [Erysipelotrichia bacterium]